MSSTQKTLDRGERFERRVWERRPERGCGRRVGEKKIAGSEAGERREEGERGEELSQISKNSKTNKKKQG